MLSVTNTVVGFVDVVLGFNYYCGLVIVVVVEAVDVVI
jgi:hypothetical protein